MKTRCLFEMNWRIGIVIGLFSIFLATQTFAEGNSWFFPHLKIGQGWKTTLSITNLEDNDIDLNISFYDEEGNPLGETVGIEGLQVGQTTEINGKTIPYRSKSLKVESNGNIMGICVLESEDGTKSEAIPLIREEAKQLDFPLLAQDDIYYKSITLLNPNPMSVSIKTYALDNDGFEIGGTSILSLSPNESRDLHVRDIFDNETLNRLSTVRVISDEEIIGLQLAAFPNGDLVGLPALINSVLTTTVNLEGVPFIHQECDTPNNFEGCWACGATSAVIILASYGILTPDDDFWTSKCVGQHLSPYGKYVSEQYSYDEHTFATMTLSPKQGHCGDKSLNENTGTPAYGAYGFIHYNDNNGDDLNDNTGNADPYRAMEYFQKHGLNSEVKNSADVANIESIVKAEIDGGRPVWASTKLWSSSGHVVVIKGYTDEGVSYKGTNCLSKTCYIVNDPWKGENCKYTWSEMKTGSKWIVTARPDSYPIPSMVISFAINNGAATAKSRGVTLNNTTTGSPTEYLASEDSTFSGAIWLPYSTAPSFILSPGNGTKTVYFKVRNGGNVESGVVSDSITLNEKNTPPALANGSVNPASGNTSTDFYWQVDYKDDNGDIPTVKQVYIDGTAYYMGLSTGADSNGTYRFGPKKLLANKHKYYFYYEDGRGGKTRLPKSGTFSGPDISESTNQPPNISSLLANPLAVVAGGTSTISASASDPEGDPLTYTWSASGGSLSTSSGPGPVTWTAPGTPGTYTITVSVTDNKPGHNPVSRSVDVTVSVSTVTLTLYVHEGSANGPVLAGAQVTGSDGAGVGFNSTTNSSGYVTLIGTAGIWQFSVSKIGYNTNTWSQNIPVTETLHVFLTVSKTVSSLTVNPSSWTFTSAGAKQLSATATYTDNSSEDVTAKATWTSSNSNVAMVSNSGLVTSGQNGSATITATHAGKSGTCNVAVSTSIVAAPWPMFGHDAEHTGRSPYAGPEATPTVKWTSSFFDSVSRQSILSPDGTMIYGVGTGLPCSGCFAAGNVLLGKNTAAAEIKRFEADSNISATPAVDSNGVLYFGDDSGNIYALYPNFTPKWKKSYVDNYIDYLIAPPTIGSDGNIYMVGNHCIVCIRPEGTLKWRYTPTPGCPLCNIFVSPLSPAIGKDGTVYFGVANDGVNGTGGLVALNADGSFRWKHTFQDPTDPWKGAVSPIISPAIGPDGTIYIGTFWNFYAISHDGNLKWLRPTSGNYYILAVPAIGPDETIYIDLGDVLTALRPENGSTKWTFNSFSSLSLAASIAVDSNGLVCAGSQDYLYAIKPDGSMKWQFYSSYAYFTSPKIGQDGTIYVHHELSKLSALK